MMNFKINTIKILLIAGIINTILSVQCYYYLMIDDYLNNITVNGKSTGYRRTQTEASKYYEGILDANQGDELLFTLENTIYGMGMSGYFILDDEYYFQLYKDKHEFYMEEDGNQNMNYIKSNYIYQGLGTIYIVGVSNQNWGTNKNFKYYLPIIIKAEQYITKKVYLGNYFSSYSSICIESTTETKTVGGNSTHYFTKYDAKTGIYEYYTDQSKRTVIKQYYLNCNDASNPTNAISGTTIKRGFFYILVSSSGQDCIFDGSISDPGNEMVCGDEEKTKNFVLSLFSHKDTKNIYKNGNYVENANTSRTFYDQTYSASQGDIFKIEIGSDEQKYSVLGRIMIDGYTILITREHHEILTEKSHTLVDMDGWYQNPFNTNEWKSHDCVGFLDYSYYTGTAYFYITIPIIIKVYGGNKKNIIKLEDYFPSTSSNILIQTSASSSTYNNYSISGNYEFTTSEASTVIIYNYGLNCSTNYLTSCNKKGLIYFLVYTYGKLCYYSTVQVTVYCNSAQCIVGFYKDSNNNCQPCGDGCQSCNSTHCKQCKTDYYIKFDDPKTCLTEENKGIYEFDESDLTYKKSDFDNQNFTATGQKKIDGKNEVTLTVDDPYFYFPNIKQINLLQTHNSSTTKHYKECSTDNPSCNKITATEFENLVFTDVIQENILHSLTLISTAGTTRTIDLFILDMSAPTFKATGEKKEEGSSTNKVTIMEEQNAFTFTSVDNTELNLKAPSNTKNNLTSFSKELTKIIFNEDIKENIFHSIKLFVGTEGSSDIELFILDTSKATFTAESEPDSGKQKVTISEENKLFDFSVATKFELTDVETNSVLEFYKECPTGSSCSLFTLSSDTKSIYALQSLQEGNKYTVKITFKYREDIQYGTVDGELLIEDGSVKLAATGEKNSDDDKSTVTITDTLDTYLFENVKKIILKKHGDTTNYEFLKTCSTSECDTFTLADDKKSISFEEIISPNSDHEIIAYDNNDITKKITFRIVDFSRAVFNLKEYEKISKGNYLVKIEEENKNFYYGLLESITLKRVYDDNIEVTYTANGDEKYKAYDADQYNYVEFSGIIKEYLINKITFQGTESSNIKEFDLKIGDINTVPFKVIPIALDDTNGYTIKIYDEDDIFWFNAVKQIDLKKNGETSSISYCSSGCSKTFDSDSVNSNKTYISFIENLDVEKEHEITLTFTDEQTRTIKFTIDFTSYTLSPTSFILEKTMNSLSISFSLTFNEDYSSESINIINDLLYFESTCISDKCTKSTTNDHIITCTDIDVSEIKNYYVSVNQGENSKKAIQIQRPCSEGEKFYKDDYGYHCVTTCPDFYPYLVEASDQCVESCTSTNCYYCESVDYRLYATSGNNCELCGDGCKICTTNKECTVCYDTPSIHHKKYDDHTTCLNEDNKGEYDYDSTDDYYKKSDIDTANFTVIGVKNEGATNNVTITEEDRMFFFEDITKFEVIQNHNSQTTSYVKGQSTPEFTADGFDSLTFNQDILENYEHDIVLHYGDSDKTRTLKLFILDYSKAEFKAVGEQKDGDNHNLVTITEKDSHFYFDKVTKVELTQNIANPPTVSYPTSLEKNGYSYLKIKDESIKENLFHSIKLFVDDNPSNDISLFILDMSKPNFQAISAKEGSEFKITIDSENKLFDFSVLTKIEFSEVTSTSTPIEATTSDLTLSSDKKSVSTTKGLQDGVQYEITLYAEYDGETDSAVLGEYLTIAANNEVFNSVGVKEEGGILVTITEQTTTGYNFSKVNSIQFIKHEGTTITICKNSGTGCDGTFTSQTDTSISFNEEVPYNVIHELILKDQNNVKKKTTLQVINLSEANFTIYKKDPRTEIDKYDIEIKEQNLNFYYGFLDKIVLTKKYDNDQQTTYTSTGTTDETKFTAYDDEKYDYVSFIADIKPYLINEVQLIGTDSTPTEQTLELIINDINTLSFTASPIDIDNNKYSIKIVESTNVFWFNAVNKIKLTKNGESTEIIYTNGGNPGFDYDTSSHYVTFNEQLEEEKEHSITLEMKDGQSVTFTFIINFSDFTLNQNTFYLEPKMDSLDFSVILSFNQNYPTEYLNIIKKILYFDSDNISDKCSQSSTKSYEFTISNIHVTERKDYYISLRQSDGSKKKITVKLPCSEDKYFIKTDTGYLCVTECTDEYPYLVVESTQCIKSENCDDANCYYCSLTTSNLYLVKGKRCQQCGDGCKECDLSTKICSLCYDDYYHIFDDRTTCLTESNKGDYYDFDDVTQTYKKSNLDTSTFTIVGTTKDEEGYNTVTITETSQMFYFPKSNPVKLEQTHDSSIQPISFYDQCPTSASCEHYQADGFNSLTFKAEIQENVEHIVTIYDKDNNQKPLKLFILDFTKSEFLASGLKKLSENSGKNKVIIEEYNSHFYFPKITKVDLTPTWGDMITKSKLETEFTADEYNSLTFIEDVQENMFYKLNLYVNDTKSKDIELFILDRDKANLKCEMTEEPTNTYNFIITSTDNLFTFSVIKEITLQSEDKKVTYRILPTESTSDNYKFIIENDAKVAFTVENMKQGKKYTITVNLQYRQDTQSKELENLIEIVRKEGSDIKAKGKLIEDEDENAEIEIYDGNENINFDNIVKVIVKKGNSNEETSTFERNCTGISDCQEFDTNEDETKILFKDKIKENVLNSLSLIDEDNNEKNDINLVIQNLNKADFEIKNTEKTEDGKYKIQIKEKDDEFWFGLVKKVIITKLYDNNNEIEYQNSCKDQNNNQIENCNNFNTDDNKIEYIEMTADLKEFLINEVTIITTKGDSKKFNFTIGDLNTLNFTVIPVDKNEKGEYIMKISEPSKRFWFGAVYSIDLTKNDGEKVYFCSNENNCDNKFEIDNDGFYVTFTEDLAYGVEHNIVLGLTDGQSIDLDFKLDFSHFKINPSEYFIEPKVEGTTIDLIIEFEEGYFENLEKLDIPIYYNSTDISDKCKVDSENKFKLICNVETETGEAVIDIGGKSDSSSSNQKVIISYPCGGVKKYYKENNEYICIENIDDPCPQNYSLLVSDTLQCVTNCEDPNSLYCTKNILYEYDSECILNCPEKTIKNNETRKCDDETTEKFERSRIDDEIVANIKEFELDDVCSHLEIGGKDLTRSDVVELVDGLSVCGEGCILYDVSSLFNDNNVTCNCNPGPDANTITILSKKK